MKQADIKVGGLYTARVSGDFVTVRVDAIRETGGRSYTTALGTARKTRETTVYDVTNLKTGKKLTFRSAAKFRSEVDPKYQTCVGGCGKQDTSANRPWRCLECSKNRSSFVAKGEVIESKPLNDGTAKLVNREVVTNEELIKGMEGEQRSDPTPTGTTHMVCATSASNLSSSTVTPPSSVQPQGARMISGLASRIAQLPKEPDTKLTQQQQDILAVAREVEAVRGESRVLVIGAGAGTGKTFTLKQLEQVLTGNGQYTAFNSSLVAESKAKFKHAACNTTHSLAFRAVGRRFSHRLNKERVKSYQIAAMLGINDFVVELSDTPYPKDSYEYIDSAIAAGYGSDNPPPDSFRPCPTRRLKAAWLAGKVIGAIRRFCMSDEREITTKHFESIPGLDAEKSYTNSDKVKAYLLPFAHKAWADLTSENGRLPFAHGVYVKLWQLGTGEDRPVIATDYILLDEAQDTAPVMLDILRQQVHALLILVGDDNQQIYEWRGAVNAMASFKGAPRKLLSQSFRFGQTVADVANAVLTTLEEPTDMVMEGTPSIPTRVCKVEEPRCYLYRTNAGAIGRLMSARAEGKRGHLIGGTKEVIDFCRAAEELQLGVGTSHPELGCFASWGEVQTYSKEEEGADLRLMVKLIDEFGAANIRATLEDMPKEKDADLVVSTAHRSKGREWASVRLGPDFPTKNKLSDADRRLIYVAATRAQEELDITECPTFCGGYDKTASGEGGEARWIPGIEIIYTVPMPTEEALAAYRAEKAAKAASAPRPAHAPTPVSIAPPAATVAATPVSPPPPPPSAAAIQQLVASTAERVVTYTKLPSGDWGMWASAAITEGEVVEVRTRTGAIKRERVGKIVLINEQAKKWLATIAR